MWEIHHIKLLFWQTPRAAFCPPIGVAGHGCITRLSNTHSTGERRVLYEFHPWAGQDVSIDQVVTRGGVSVARCRLPGSSPGLPLELPLWMFDRLACSAVRRQERGQVDWAALQALQDLLSRVVRDDGGDRDFPPAACDRRSDLRSGDPSQGADHAPIPPEVHPVRSVRSSGPQPPAEHAAMAESAAANAPAGDCPDDSVVSGTLPDRCRRSRGGGQRGAPESGER